MTTPERIMPERKFYGSRGGALVMHLAKLLPDMVRPLKDGEKYIGRFILPPFQRSFVWTRAQQEKLIESIYLGMPIGSIVWNQTYIGCHTDDWLLDGQQRLTTIVDYINGVFPVCGYLYPDLPHSEKVHFERMSVDTIETNLRTTEDCLDVYNRLAYGGTAHT